MSKLRNLNVSENVEKLRRVYDYNPKTGVFRWGELTPNNATPGSIAGTDNGRGYIKLMFMGKQCLAHRLAWMYVYGTLPSQPIDHINQIKSDNRIANLRMASATINGRNQPLHSSNKTGVSGVRWENDRQKWKVAVHFDGKQKTVGRYSSLLDAVAARFRAYREAGYSEMHGVAT